APTEDGSCLRARVARPRQVDVPLPRQVDVPLRRQRRGGELLLVTRNAGLRYAPPTLHRPPDAGAIVTRYDKRLLSRTEAAYMYTPGTAPTVFDVDGYRFGTALCIEIQYPE